MNIKKIDFGKLFTYSSLSTYILSVIITGVVALLCAPLANTQSYHVVSFILLFVVSIMATFMGTGPVLLASTLSALAWNYFFIPPHLTFHIEKTEDILIFGMFFIIALLNGILTTRVRRQEKLTREREEKTNALFQLTKQLSKVGGIKEIISISKGEIKTNFLIDSTIILQDGNNDLQITDEEYIDTKYRNKLDEIVRWVFTNSKKAGLYTDNFVDSEFTVYPLTGTILNPGVIIVKHNELFNDEKKIFWETFITQISNAIEREFLGELAQKARFLDETDKLYKTLFNSISHELRIPVSTIMGASDSLLNSSHTGNIQSVLYNEIFTASVRLNRLIENLLNITRLESGHISIRLDWYDINDLINQVAENLEDDLKPYSLKLNIQEDMPLVRIDFGLMEQVLYNLLFNSTQYAPVASDIKMSINHNKKDLLIAISDKGPGFPEKEIKNVFKKFFRVNSSKAGGLGLGLSIVKGFVEAHKGQITVNNRITGGCEFLIRIPSENPEIDTLNIYE